jgi:hypothetical protein
MNRRDFLFLRRTPRGRVLELSCRALYLRTLDANAPTTQSKDDVFNHEPWMGEPPTDFDKSADDDWLVQLEAQLRNVAVLRLLDEEWLASTQIKQQLEPLLSAFRARGGLVEYTNSQDAPKA